MRKLRVLALMHKDLVPPSSLDGLSDREIVKWKSEYDVVTALQELGHECRPLGIDDDLAAIRTEIREGEPHIVFNLLEEFGGLGFYVPFILGYLELIRVPYTGCNPRGMLLSDNKPLMKKILKHHRVPMPDFAFFPRGRKVQRPSRLAFPLIVKSATEHGSVGIAQASVVNDDDQLRERVEYVHESQETDAIAEEYIDGRELYVGVLGNSRLRTFPIWEMQFDDLPEGAPRVATEKIKWDVNYQERTGITTRAAKDLPEGTEERITKMCKRVYRIQSLSGYARMDMRLTPDNKVYFLEPNANPDLSLDEDFALSAEAAGIGYEGLIQRILDLGLRYPAGWKR